MGKLKKLLKPIRKLKICYKNIRDLGYSRIDTVWIILDMAYCRVRFHCLIPEYLRYDFMNRKDRDRKYFLLRYHQKVRYGLVRRGTPVHDRKAEQYKYLKEFLGREYIRVDECDYNALAEFVGKHKKVIFKPSLGSCGRDIFAYEESENDLMRVYTEVAGKDFLCEQYIVQHDKMNELQPSSVNTVRVVTLNYGDKVSIVATGFRIGDGESACDNRYRGGLTASVDPETGVVITGGYTFERECFLVHPKTGVQIIGFEIPNWDKVIEITKKAARTLPQRPIYGWDVAVTPDGAVIIESNSGPGPSLNQIADQKPKGKEIMEFIANSKDKYVERNRKIRRQMRKFY